MDFCTQQDVITRFGEQEIVQLTDRAIPTTGVIDATVLAAAIADATDEITPYLSGRYQLPMATVPGALVRVACNLARYHLYDDVPPDEVRRRYDDGLRFLRGVADGKISLADDTGAQATPSGGAEIQSAGSVFSRENAGGFI